VVPAWPPEAAPPALVARIFGVFLVAAGLAIVLERAGRAAATALAAVLLVSFLFLHLPLAAGDGWWGGKWTSAGKALALFAGALAVGRTFAAADPRGEPGTAAALDVNRRLPALARAGFGLFLALCGVQHFVWDRFVATLVPAWIPGPYFWTYFTGVALLPGGLGLLVPATARAAALWSGRMILVWVVVLHIPRALSDLRDSNETTAVFEALAMSGIAFLLARADGPEPVAVPAPSVPADPVTAH